MSLDITYCYPEDQGTYTCRATNALGQAVISADLGVVVIKTIDKDTIHQGAMDQIGYLEKSHARHVEEEGPVDQAPAFTCQMRDHTVTEGSSAHFEAKLVPVGDTKLKVDWFKDGQPLQASNRLSTLHDFGFVALDLKYTRPSDTGVYTCHATNALGQADLSAKLTVMSLKDGPNAETLHEDALEKIAYLEHRPAHKRAEEEEAASSPPQFVVKLQGKTNLIEGQNIHMECRIEPYPDQTLQVEWMHNGRPLPFGNRWRTSYDFGFAALDIVGAYAEDSGTYAIKATNALGTAHSELGIKVTRKCICLYSFLMP